MRTAHRRWAALPRRLGWPHAECWSEACPLTSMIRNLLQPQRAGVDAPVWVLSPPAAAGVTHGSEARASSAPPRHLLAGVEQAIGATDRRQKPHSEARSYSGRSPTCVPLVPGDPKPPPRRRDP